MRRGILLAALLLFWTVPASACAGKIVSTAARAPLSYNPFVPVDAQQEIAIKVQNSGSDRCAYQLSIPNRYLPLQFATGLRFAILAGSWQETLVAATPLLQPRQTYDLRLTLLVYRGQAATAGTVSRLVGFSLTPSGGRTPVDEIQLNLACVIPPLFQINLAGSGTRTSMEFSSLNPNGTKSVVMQTRATQGHRLEFQSTAGALLREGSPANELLNHSLRPVHRRPNLRAFEGYSPSHSRHARPVKPSADGADRRYEEQTGWHLQGRHHSSHCIRHVS